MTRRDLFTRLIGGAAAMAATPLVREARSAAGQPFEDRSFGVPFEWTGQVTEEHAQALLYNNDGMLVETRTLLVYSKRDVYETKGGSFRTVEQPL